VAPTSDMRLCIDRLVRDRYQPARAAARQALEELADQVAEGEVAGGEVIDASQVIPPARLALITLKKWSQLPNGNTLRCRFLDGSSIQQQKVEAEAKRWEPYVNISFEFGDDPDSEIRISFEADPGSWSAVGTDALIEQYFPKFQPTMNFGWLHDDTNDMEYERVVVHEFGHALGCIHEHQSPAADLKWNEPEVYRVFSGPPNYWTPAQIKHNIIDKYSAGQTQFTQFDPDSIMLYPFPGTLFVGGKGTHSNTELSATDERFITQLYPKP
jgi:hypothetical protein